MAGQAQSQSVPGEAMLRGHIAPGLASYAGDEPLKRDGLDAVFAHHGEVADRLERLLHEAEDRLAPILTPESPASVGTLLTCSSTSNGGTSCCGARHTSRIRTSSGRPT
jgi:hypothetical protein